MANIKAAQKAIRTSGRSYELNRALRRRIKTWQKKIDTIVAEKKTKQAKTAMDTFTQLLDKAAKRNVYSMNKASRYKSRYQKKLNTLGKK